MHDFTRSLRDDPKYPYEPTKDWIWYKPGDDPPPSLLGNQRLRMQ